jgi:fermentation-respiration switch protein FrsA (DUF1100 family)
MSVILIITVALVFLNLVIYQQQAGMIFYPTKDVDQSPTDWGMAFEEVDIEAADGIRLHGWFIPRDGANRVLLFFHGNAGNISHRGDTIHLFHRLGMNVLIIDYRGYGKSQGTPSEAGLYRDARAAWDYLVDEKQYSKQDIIIFGRSLGGAVAADLAMAVKPGGLILESTFSSARDMARQIFSVITYLLHIRYSFDTVDKLAHINSPVLVLHSREDEIIPHAQGIKVYEAANEPKQFFEMKGDHNYGFIQSQPGYEIKLADWLRGIEGERNK